MTKSVFTDAYATFLDVLIAARKDAGVTQIELGARLGKTQTFVSTFERGVRRVDVIEFYAIARALNIDPMSLFGDLVGRMPRKVDI